MKKRGFTLMELLVAISLTMIVGYLISLAFHNTSTVSKKVMSNLDYNAKGRAILERIAFDISNLVQTYSLDFQATYPASSATSVSHRDLGFRTHLPRLRTRYGSGDFGFQHNYSSDLIAVRWWFDSANGGKLYRATAPEYQVIPNNERIGDMEGLLNRSLNESNFKHRYVQPANLVSSGDIRAFRIESSSHVHPAVGSQATQFIPDSFTVSFYLTNAPAKATSPNDSSSNCDGAACDNFIWVRFYQVISNGGDYDAAP